MRLNIRAVVDRVRARNWQKSAISVLRDQGHTVSIIFHAPARPLPLILSSLLALERLIYGASAASPGADWETAGVETGPDYDPDLVLDFTSSPDFSADARILRVQYAGSVLEEASYAELLNARSPLLAISDSAAADAPRTFRIAIEDPFLLTSAMDIIGARLGEFLCEAVTEIAHGGVISASLGAAPYDRDWQVNTWSTGDTMAALAARARSAIRRLTTKAPHWYVGWRRTKEDSLADTFTIPRGGWHKLPDDGQRFYADPFLVRRDGRDWMFLEEFPYSTRKGIISAVEVGLGGPIGRPQPVLELGSHLSYPFIFERDGATWMIPESSTAKRVDLYRCVEFPYRWELASILLDGEEVSDATLVEHNGRLWMFGTASDGWQSSWDTLRIWTADQLTGRWFPISSTPTIVDSVGARPAGAFFVKDRVLWRPTQDCSTGYGHGLAMARVDMLDLDGFEQTITAVIRPNSDWPGFGLHTVNAVNDLEAVDGCSN